MKAVTFIANALAVLVAAGPVAAGELDDWPGFHIALGATYAPAPKFNGYERGDFITAKLLDQVGLHSSLEWRIWNYGLLGGNLDSSLSGSSGVVDAGLRGGGLYEVDDHWALYALLFVELAYLRIGAHDHVLDPCCEQRESFFGWGAGGAVGFRYRYHDRLGTYVELSGIANRFGKIGFDSEDSDLEKPYLARLQLSAGFLFGFYGSQARAPEDGAGE